MKQKKSSSILAKHGPTAFLIADLAGTFVFAVGGAIAALGARLDLLGIMVLAFATALGGGMIRDVLLGSTPPFALSDIRYPLAAFLGGGLTIAFHSLITATQPAGLIVADAAGLSLFAVTGTTKALDRAMAPLIAVLLGTITAVGGGTIRDILLSQIPAVLHTDIYASAALLGAVALVVLSRLGMNYNLAAFTGGILCFALRLLGNWEHWQLPRF